MYGMTFTGNEPIFYIDKLNKTLQLGMKHLVDVVWHLNYLSSYIFGASSGSYFIFYIILKKMLF